MIRFISILVLAVVLTFPASAQGGDTARLQVIHNAADPAADTVDIYLGATRLLDNFAFRTATPFIDAPAGSPIVIGVAPGNSSSVNDTITSFTLTLTPGEKYVAIANGVLAPGSFAPNPDGRSTGFTLFIKTLARESGSGGNVEFAALHGATDAPTVDVVARGVATLVNNAAYGDVTGYIAVPPAVYTLDVKDSSGTVTVASFGADLSGLANGAAVVFASGFLTPSANQNGPAFGLYAALPNGTVVTFGPATSVVTEETVPEQFSLSQNYPNPFNPATRIRFALPARANVRLTVYDILGREVALLVDEVKNEGRYEVEFSGTGLASGVYYYTLRTGGKAETRTMVLMK